MVPQRFHPLVNLVFAALIALMATAPMVAVRAQAAATTEGPEQLVLRVSNDVLDAIKADKQIQSGDSARLQKLVDDKVLPNVDFEKMTRLAVGRGWRQATPEQQQTLLREFRVLLIRTYSGAVSQVRDHKVQLRPLRAQPADTDVVVRTNVVGGQGDPIQLDYRVEKTEAGWKIYDVNVVGVWLIENYKSAFAQAINAGGIDGLIKFITDRNRSGDAKKS